MKRLLTIGLMLVSAFAFTNCAEQLDSPTMESDTIVESTDDVLLDTDYSYLVYLDEAETKTYYESGKIYWADKASAEENEIDVDYIHLFSSESSKEDYKYHNAFEYVGGMSFAGNLSSELSDENDWFCVYPHLTPNSSSGSTNIKAIPVTLGAESVIQEGNGSKSHLVGKTCPLYGIKNRVPKNKNPKFNKMSHMVAVVALNIVNNGHGGDIVVKSAGLTASEEIVGDFDVNILGNPSKNIYDPIFTKKTNAKKSTKVELSSAVAIKYGESATLYLAVKPFDASGKELTISINGDAKKGNGASKTITMPTGSKFEAGKVTTITVPVEKLFFHNENVDPATSNVIGAQASVVTGTNYGGITGLKPVSHKIENKDAILINGSKATSTSIIINGKSTQAYVVGTSETNPGTVVIRGTAQDLLPYVPMEFYAASWNNTKAVMRLENLLVYMWDIPLAHQLGLSYSLLTEGDKPIIADKSKITFSGLLPLEQVPYSNQKYATILDEEPYHKPLSIKKIEELLSRFDDNKTDDQAGFKPTFEGLKAAIGNPSSVTTETQNINNLTSARDITAYILWNKINSKVASSSTIKNILGVFTSFLDSPKEFFKVAATTPIEVTLSTVSKGTDGATDCRMIFWGLNSSSEKYFPTEEE